MMEPPSKRHKQESPFGIRPLESPADTPYLATGGRKPLKVGPQTLQRLQSVERIFCSQTLDTPTAATSAAERQGKEDECMAEPSSPESGFMISYSQHYTRMPSQSEERDDREAGIAEGCSCGAGPSSWESEATRQGGFPRPHAHSDRDTTPEQYQPEAGETTPELCLPEPCIAGGPSSADKLFPIFRPKSQWKTVHIIRHGESEYNAATQYNKGFDDPQIYDPKLTAKGRRQAMALRPQLEALKISKDALWLCSPLTRALETMVLACPQSARIGARDQPLNVVVRKELSEHIVTTGDIGLPASAMKASFPQFSKAMEGLPERWWFGHTHNDARTQRFDKHESKKAMKERVGEFRRWVQNRPEKVVVAFGHSSIFHELTGSKRLKNCEVHTMHL